MIRPNRKHPLNQGRQGWWLQLPALVGNGNVLADCWGSLPATSPAMPTPVPGLGVAALAGHYNGSTQYASATCPTLTAYTAVAWVRFDNFSGASILKNWGNISVEGYFHWDAIAAGPGVVRLYAKATGGISFVTASNTLSTGVAYRLAITAGGGNMALYCNGNSVGTDVYSGTLTSNASAIGFGCKFADDQVTPSSGSASLLAGTMGDVSLWNRALSAAEIAQLDAEMRAGYPNLLIRDRTPVGLLQQRGRFQRIGMDGGFPAYAGGF